MLWWGMYMIIFAPKLLNISWHTSGLCQVALAQTIPRHSWGIIMSQDRFQQALTPLWMQPCVPAGLCAQEHPRACSIYQCKGSLVDHWHEAWLFGEALETLQSVTEDPKIKSPPVFIRVPSTHAKAFNFCSSVILGHRELCVHSSQSFLPARDRAPWELCPEHIYAKKKYF